MEEIASDFLGAVKRMEEEEELPVSLSFGVKAAKIVAEEAKKVAAAAEAVAEGAAEEAEQSAASAVVAASGLEAAAEEAEETAELAVAAEDRANAAFRLACRVVNKAVGKEVIPPAVWLLSAAKAAEEVAEAANELQRVGEVVKKVIDFNFDFGSLVPLWTLVTGKIASEASVMARRAVEGYRKLFGKIQRGIHFPSTKLAISSNPSLSSTAPNEQAGGTILYHNQEEYLDSFPPGYRFNPTDEELILHYLHKKINDDKLPPNRIKDVQLYNFDTPEDLITGGHTLSEREDKLYFFTLRNKKGPKGERLNRETPGGSWIPTSGIDKIYNQENVTGYKTTLCFFKGKSKRSEKTKTNWIMHEYAVESSGGGLKRDNWVLCSIYKRREPKNKRSRESKDEGQE